MLQGRYKAWLVEKDEKFLDNCRYVVNNPVEAKMVEHPSDWPWSSFRATRGMQRVPEYLEIDFLLRHFSLSRNKAQKFAERPLLENIFVNNHQPKPLKNLLIREAYEKHRYTLREIGHYLQLNPDYLSRIIAEIKKTSEGRS